MNDGIMHHALWSRRAHRGDFVGIADLLSRRQGDLAGEFTLLFQPAEEALGGAIAT